MKLYPLVLLLLAAATLTVHAAPISMTEEERQHRIGAIEKFVNQALVKFEPSLTAPVPNADTRDYAQAALAYLLLGNGNDASVAKAQAALERFMSIQNMNASSPEFGKVPWNAAKPEIHDGNAIEFSASAMSSIFISYGDRFPKSFLDKVRPHLHAALVAVANHNQKISYTNIALMNASNQILLGEYLQDAAAVTAGKERFEEWIKYTRANGIAEFDSPTYSQTQISLLYEIYHNVRDPSVKAEAKLVLDYYWTELAANFFPGSGGLCGPNSRTYSFLANDSNLTHVYYLNGLPARLSKAYSNLNDEVQILAPALWNDYTPPVEALLLAGETPRLILQRWGPLPGQDRSNYITSDFSIGSASHSNGAQDRLVTATLASMKPLPFISVIPDQLDSPYGNIHVMESGGHSKNHHLTVPISVAQDHGSVLALLDLAPGLEKEASSSISTDVILPLHPDSLVVDGKPVAWNKDGVPVDTNSVIGIREANGAMAIRIFTAETAPGSSPAFFLKNDGEEWGAARLVAYHYKGANTQLKVSSLRSGILLLAGHCASDTEFQSFLQQAKNWSIVQSDEGALWKVKAQGTEGSSKTLLEASLDLASKETGPRSVNGQPVSLPVLSINGVDWAEKIWAKLP